MEQIHQVSIKEDDIIVSFDVKLLFTEVPIEEALMAIETRLNEQTDRLAKVCSLLVPDVLEITRFD